MTLRLIADDLTGALDAAAPFATPASPVRLLLDARAGGGKLTHSTESRNLPEAEALARVIRAVAAMDGGPETLWFKKVDSVLRGHPLTETLAMARAGRFATCVFAPAFPEMGRITRQGRHLVRDGEAWAETPHGDLRTTFATLQPDYAPGLQVLVPDAETQDQLRDAIQPWRERPGVLWAGSRGLAQALQPDRMPLPCPAIGVFILGTSHPVTRAQATALSARAAPMTGPIRPDAAAPVLIDPVPTSRSSTATGDALAASLRRLVRPDDGSGLLVTGGDCLTVVLAAIGAGALDCEGEVAPGLPLSRIAGGRLDGVPVVTKSGGFGGTDLLERLAGRR